MIPDRTDCDAKSAEEKHAMLVAQIKKEIRAQPPDHPLYLSTVHHLEEAVGQKNV